jgi:hypothetical protein
MGDYSMKKYALLSLVFAIFLVGFDPENLVRFTVINQSEVKIGIRLINKEKDLNYYLTVEKGDKEDPEEKEFTIVPAIYDMQVFYTENYDPVYGYPECQGTVLPGKLIAVRNLRLTFSKCLFMPAGIGTEPTMMKFWLWKPWKFKYIIIK